MSMREAIAAALLVALAGAQARAEGPALGRAASAGEIALFDISVGPDGVGLPPGAGAARQGRLVYEARCIGCHGEKGEGKPNDRLVGGFGTLKGGQAAVKTIGSYWPYATTVFDYVRRAMPFDAPKSLTDEEVYAVTAYLLHLNGIVGEDVVVNAQTLPKIEMPNRGGFTLYTPGK
ncbi:c-type cytochrome [Methylosinus sp. Ce-a6]|uniref:c-type cytochrome n=1 Tax=Methylosinus sp. Ce-a6 TaxID=2172005 RepID=UPI001358F9CB|nr:cytochrome c [Methylosinus sp. Ce-a6]